MLFEPNRIAQDIKKIPQLDEMASTIEAGENHQDIKRIQKVPSGNLT